MVSIRSGDSARLLFLDISPGECVRSRWCLSLLHASSSGSVSLGPGASQLRHMMASTEMASDLGTGAGRRDHPPIHISN